MTLQLVSLAVLALEMHHPSDSTATPSPAHVRHPTCQELSRDVVVELRRPSSSLASVEASVAAQR